MRGKIKEKEKEILMKHESVLIGDFFIATCWRLQIAFFTFVAACIAALIGDVCAFVYFFIFVSVLFYFISNRFCLVFFELIR